jgi:hypothetical protein
VTGLTEANPTTGEDAVLLWRFDTQGTVMSCHSNHGGRIAFHVVRRLSGFGDRSRQWQAFRRFSPRVFDLAFSARGSFTRNGNPSTAMTQDDGAATTGGSGLEQFDLFPTKILNRWLQFNG